MKRILMLYLILTAASLQAQMHLGAASFICSDCSSPRQGSSFAGMMGMVYNGAWPSADDELVAIHYFLPFLSGRLASPIYEIGPQNVVVTVYPNPTTEFIYISGEVDFQNPILISLTNSIGQVTLEKKWNPHGNLLRLKVGHLPSGFYALTLSGSNYIASHILQIIH